MLTWESITKMFFCVYCSKWCHILEDRNLNTPHYHNIGSHTYIYKTTPMKQSIWKAQRSYVMHCPHLRKMNSVYDILLLCSRSTLILSSHLQVGLPSGFYHKTIPTHFSTNAVHSGCHVCASISSTLHFKESCKCTASLFVQYRFLQVFNYTVI